MTSAAQAALAADRAALRQALAARGFTDDGDVLRGPVQWRAPEGRQATSVVDITIPGRYPFGPPAVRLTSLGDPVEVTFHRDLDGALCLWDTSEPVANGPWTDPDLLLSRIAGWLENTAAGWPDDEDCDLERYLPACPRSGIVLYDHDAIRPLEGYLRTRETQVPGVVTVLASPWNLPRTAGKRPPKGKKAAPLSAPRRLAYSADIGPLRSPVRDWDDLSAALGGRAGELRRLINQGSVELLLLWYRRGQREAVLALAAKPGQPPVLTAREAADTSPTARTLRAGADTTDLAGKQVAIIGCGAVGSYAADLLYREGARRLTLVDPQLLRPGNAVRHLAPPSLAGLPKADAVKHVLLSYEFGGDDIETKQSRIADPGQAIEILMAVQTWSSMPPRTSAPQRCCAGRRASPAAPGNRLRPARRRHRARRQVSTALATKSISPRSRSYRSRLPCGNEDAATPCPSRRHRPSWPPPSSQPSWPATSSPSAGPCPRPRSASCARSTTPPTTTCAR